MTVAAIAIKYQDYIIIMEAILAIATGLITW